MAEQMRLDEIVDRLSLLATDASAFFDKAQIELEEISREGRFGVGSPERDHFWEGLSDGLRHEARALVSRLLSLAGHVVTAAREAPLASDADARDVMLGTKAMRAALQLREFRSWDTEVIHDEGTILGTNPPGQSDESGYPPEMARRTFDEWVAKFREIVDLAAASPPSRLLSDGAFSAPARYRPGTAFIMMSMDKSQPELLDVADAVKEVFSRFDIRAIRADDIEHEGLITQRVLDEIRSSEICFADLTGERPNVYYEVGYAHALDRRVILYRKEGTGIHFDLAGYNCPGYTNLGDLKKKLTQRLQQITNRAPKDAR
jgi:hypothetical protein